MNTVDTQLQYAIRQNKWLHWHNDNPKVWELFEKFALEAIQAGKQKLSHWLIINRIRWETSITTTGEDFKIANDHIAFYARLWAEKHPEYSFLFRTKRMTGELI